VPHANAIVADMALMFDTTPQLVQRAIAAGLLAYDLAALPRFRTRAHRLEGERAEAYYQSWEHGFTPLHVQFARALNQLMSLACYEQPAMTEQIGYRPAAWIREVTAKRLAVFDADIRAQAAQLIAPDPLRPRTGTAETKTKKEVA